MACTHVKQQGGIIFSFDDDYIDEWHEFKNVFSEHEIKATFFISNPQSLDSLKVLKLKDLQNDNHEIACHGYNHLNSLDYLDTIDIYIEKEITSAINSLKNKGFNVVSFAYPYGESTAYIDSVLLSYFTFLRKATYNIHNTDIDTYDEIYVSSSSTRVCNAMGIDCNYAISLENLEKAIQRAANNNEILILYAHKINNSGEDYTISPEYLKKAFQLCNKYRIQSLRMKDISVFSF